MPFEWLLQDLCLFHMISFFYALYILPLPRHFYTVYRMMPRDSIHFSCQVARNVFYQFFVATYGQSDLHAGRAFFCRFGYFTCYYVKQIVFTMYLLFVCLINCFHSFPQNYDKSRQSRKAAQCLCVCVNLLERHLDFGTVCAAECVSAI